MAADFDPVKAMREEVAGLRDVHALILTRAREAERKMAEAEIDFRALSKMEAYTKQTLAEAHAKLRALQDAAEKAKQ